MEDFEKVPKKEEEKEAQREDSNSEAEASGFKLPECLTQLTKTIDQLETEGLGKIKNKRKIIIIFLEVF